MPVHTHANTLTDPGHHHQVNFSTNNGAGAGSGSNLLSTGVSAQTLDSTTGITINNVSAGSGGAHAMLQPTIIVNYLLRVL
jgi:hypothetical protein